MKQRKLTTLVLALVVAPLLAGCINPGSEYEGNTNERESDDVPRPAHAVGEPRAKVRSYDPNTGITWVFDRNGNREWCAEGVTPPKCLGFDENGKPRNPTQWPGFDPDKYPPITSGSSTRSEYGLDPDEYGNLHLMVSAYAYAPVSPGKLSSGDRLTFFVVCDRHWALPWEQVPELLTAIGEDRIEIYDVPLADSAEPALMVQVNQATLGQTIEVLGRLGVKSLDFETGGTKYSLGLNGPYDDFDTILLYKDGEVSMKFSL
ncbi:MAG: hypothetical protein H6819_10500 [Phycisphaerales bacterium]|nr:hypothetical protein [Phycisphaerales bacterium]MCB9855942.1 hypothetical protein [Phycisphaerales bacterium]MCB9864077.1 hypothetical protein [Phycisphaerales bacterium]